MGTFPSPIERFGSVSSHFRARKSHVNHYFGKFPDLKHFILWICSHTLNTACALEFYLAGKHFVLECGHLVAIHMWYMRPNMYVNCGWRLRITRQNLRRGYNQWVMSRMYSNVVRRAIDAYPWLSDVRFLAGGFSSFYGCTLRSVWWYRWKFLQAPLFLASLLGCMDLW